MIRFFITLCILLLPYQSASAQTIEEQLGLTPAPVNRAEHAQRYYEQCLEQHANHESPVREVLCTCTSLAISEDLTDSGLRALFEESEDGEKARALVHESYYIPCAGRAAQTMVSMGCQRSALHTHHQRNNICDCLGEKLGTYARIHGPYIIGDKRTKGYGWALDEDSPNPFSALMSSKDFEIKNTYYTRVCIQKYTIWAAHER